MIDYNNKTMNKLPEHIERSVTQFRTVRDSEGKHMVGVQQLWYVSYGEPYERKFIDAWPKADENEVLLGFSHTEPRTMWGKEITYYWCAKVKQEWRDLPSVNLP